MQIQKDPVLSALFEHSSVGIIISSPAGFILEANPYVTKMFGYPEGELLDQKIEVLLPIGIREKHVGYRVTYNQCPEPRSMGVGKELAAMRKNGSEFPVEISLSSFLVKGELRIVSFVNDVTEKQKYRQKLEDLVDERTIELSQALVELNSTNKSLRQEMKTRKIAEEKAMKSLKREKELSELKSRFVSMASHEFRTPLAGIMTSVSLLRKYTKPEQELKREKHFTRIKSLIHSLTGILNDFLSLDKLEQGEVKVSLQKIMIKELVVELVDSLKSSDQDRKSIKCHFTLSETSFYTNREFLRIILTNLLTNAMKYSDRDSHIDIFVEDTLSNITFRIQDYGYGIPEDDQKHLFERFFRAKNVDTIQGTGLGLNIVKRYVDLLGGDISFYSKLNKGTIFNIIIPKKEASHE